MVTYTPHSSLPPPVSNFHTVSLLHCKSCRNDVKRRNIGTRPPSYEPPRKSHKALAAKIEKKSRFCPAAIHRNAHKVSKSIYRYSNTNQVTRSTPPTMSSALSLYGGTSTKSSKVHISKESSKLSEKFQPGPTEVSLRDYGTPEYGSLLENGVFADLVLRIPVEGGEYEDIMTHRVLVALISPRLESFLAKPVEGRRDDKKRQKLQVEGVKPDAVRELLTFYVKGRLDLTNDRVWDVRRAAEVLEISSIVDRCDEYISTNCLCVNCVDWMGNARSAGIKDVVTKCRDIAHKCFNKLRRTSPFLNAPYDFAHDLVSSDTIYTMNELSVLLFVLEWVARKESERRKYLKELLSCVRMRLMTSEDDDYVVSGGHGFEQFQDEINRERKQQLRVFGIDRQRCTVVVRGVQKNVPIFDVQSYGWRLVFAQPYKSLIHFSEIAKIKGDYVMVAAAKKGNDHLALCAIGKRDVVMSLTHGDETNYENGLFWYFNPERAFGFSSVPLVKLRLGDVADGEGDKKLSWHVHDDYTWMRGEGGFRAGNVKELNESEEWMKLVFSIAL